MTLSPQCGALYFVGHIRGGASAEAPEGSNERQAFENARELNELLSAMPPRISLTAMNNIATAMDPLMDLQHLAATRVDMPSFADSYQGQRDRRDDVRQGLATPRNKHT